LWQSEVTGFEMIVSCLGQPLTVGQADGKEVGITAPTEDVTVSIDCIGDSVTLCELVFMAEVVVELEKPKVMESEAVDGSQITPEHFT
jgi:hypothetical protein